MYNALPTLHERCTNQHMLMAAKVCDSKEPHCSADHQRNFDRWHITTDFFDHNNMSYSSHIYVDKLTTVYEGDRSFEPRAQRANISTSAHTRYRRAAHLKAVLLTTGLMMFFCVW